MVGWLGGQRGRQVRENRHHLKAASVARPGTSRAAMVRADGAPQGGSAESTIPALEEVVVTGSRAMLAVPIAACPLPGVRREHLIAMEAGVRNALPV